MDKQQISERFSRLWPPRRTVATTGQLLDVGITAVHVRLGLKNELLHRLRRGVFGPTHIWWDQKPWHKDKLIISAHIAATGNRYVYSHFSAARLHGLHLYNSSRLIHVSAPYHCAVSRTSKDTVVHFHKLEASDFTEVVDRDAGMVKVTSLARTVAQCVMQATFEQAVVIGDSALHKGLDIRMLERELNALDGFRGIRKARLVLQALNRLAESAGESRTRLIIAEMPVEQPELQVNLDTRCGVYRVDFAWQSIRLVLEFDGNTKYFDFSKPTEQALIDERERENALIELGWRFIRIKWKDLDNPEQLKARIMAAYLTAQRAAA